MGALLIITWAATALPLVSSDVQVPSVVEGVRAGEGRLAPLVPRHSKHPDPSSDNKHGHSASVSAGDNAPTTYPCYKATCAGNATCCHYGEADMCCW